MKKKVRMIVPVMLLLVISMFIFSGCSRVSPKSQTAATSVDKRESVDGGYTKQKRLSTEDQEMFDTVMKTVDNGKTYEAVSVATQVVAGTNYRFEVKITENGKQTEGYVVIFQPLPGQGDAEYMGEE